MCIAWLVAMAPPLIRLGMLIEFPTISYNSVLLGFSKLFSIQIFSYKEYIQLSGAIGGYYSNICLTKYDFGLLNEMSSREANFCKRKRASPNKGADFSHVNTRYKVRLAL